MPLIAITGCRKIEDYRQAIIHAGGEVRVVQHPLAVNEALANVDGLLLTGGGDVAPARYGAPPHPTIVDVDEARDAFELDLIAAVRQRSLPLFAICRGIQILN